MPISQNLLKCLNFTCANATHFTQNHTFLSFKQNKTPHFSEFSHKLEDVFLLFYLIPRSQLFHLVFFLSTFPSNFVLSTSEPASSSTPTFAIPHFASFVQSRFCYCNFCRCHSERSRLCCDYFSLLLIFLQLHFCCTPSNILSIANFIWFFEHPLVYSRLSRPLLSFELFCSTPSFAITRISHCLFRNLPSNSLNPSRSWIFLVKIYSL